MSTPKKSRKVTPAPQPEPARPLVRTAFMVIQDIDGGILVLTDKDTLALSVPEVDIHSEATPAEVESLSRSLAHHLDRQALIEAVVTALAPEPELSTPDKIRNRLAEHTKE